MKYETLPNIALQVKDPRERLERECTPCGACKPVHGYVKSLLDCERGIMRNISPAPHLLDWPPVGADGEGVELNGFAAMGAGEEYIRHGAIHIARKIISREAEHERNCYVIISQIRGCHDHSQTASF